MEYISRNPGDNKKLYKLGLVNFVSKEELVEHIKDINFGLDYFNHDLTLFQ